MMGGRGWGLSWRGGKRVIREVEAGREIRRREEIERGKYAP